MLHMNHSSRASLTVECLKINSLSTRIMNETTIFERNYIFSKYRNFSGGNFSLVPSICCFCCSVLLCVELYFLTNNVSVLLIMYMINDE